jgi:hypothetical protein
MRLLRMLLLLTSIPTSSMPKWIKRGPALRIRIANLNVNVNVNQVISHALPCMLLSSMLISSMLLSSSSSPHPHIGARRRANSLLDTDVEPQPGDLSCPPLHVALFHVDILHAALLHAALSSSSSPHPHLLILTQLLMVLIRGCVSSVWMAGQTLPHSHLKKE